MSTHADRPIPEAVERYREEYRHQTRRPTHTQPIPVQEVAVCAYCALPLPAGATAYHPACREDACERPAFLSSCPDDIDGPCEACDPTTKEI